MPRKKAEKKKPQARSNDAELSVRVEEVLRIRLDGAQLHDVREFSSEKGWGVSDRQLEKYMKAADQLLVARQEKSRRALIARRIAQREALFARAVNAADYRTALAILDSVDRLRGLYPEKDIKELVKLAAAQGTRIEDLERKLRDAHTTAETPPPASDERRTIGPADDGT